MNFEIPKALQDLENDHPSWIAARTYALSLSLSLGPALLPILLERKISRTRRSKLASILKKELSVSGFAFAMTVAAAGGAALERYWIRLSRKYNQTASTTSKCHKLSILSNIILQKLDLPPSLRTFICNVATSLLAILLMNSRRRSSQTPKVDIPLTVPISPSEGSSDGRPSATLDLTLLFFVRALDSVMQGWFLRRAEKSVDISLPKANAIRQPQELRLIRKKVAEFTDKLDALAFWIASAR